jgi:large subunit ribosomal protein L13
MVKNYTIFCDFLICSGTCKIGTCAVPYRSFVKAKIPAERILMKTFSARPADVKHDWFIVDATGKTLGRLASEIARRLRGKHKPEYTPHVDTGDYIVVINAEKIRVTGNKRNDKAYYWHTGYVGNMKSTNLEKLLQNAPERVLETAVKGMLPKNPLGRAMFRKLKVFAGPEHRHTAQQPQPLEF